MEQINLNKNVFEKRQYEKVIDTSFTQLVQPVATPTTTLTIQEFFQAYQDLFLLIPQFGDINSHEYIILTSTDYIGNIQNDEVLQSLLEEINQVRQENLDLQQELYNLTTTNTSSLNI